jgi:hypothetical protein
MIPGKNQKVDRPQVVQVPKGPGQNPCTNPAYAAMHPLVCGGSMAPRMPQVQIPPAPKAAPAAMPAPQQPQQDPMSTPGGMMQMYMGGSGAKKGFQAGVDKGWWSNPFADPARQSTFNYTPGMQAEMAAAGDVPFNPSNPSGVADWTGVGRGAGSATPPAAGTSMNPVMMNGVPVETAGVTKAGTFAPAGGANVAGFGQTTMMPGAGGSMIPVENLMTQAGTEGLLGGAEVAGADAAATAAADAAAAEALAAQQAAVLQAAAAESAAATGAGAAAAEGAAAGATGFAAAAPWIIPILAGAYMFGLLD